MQGFANAGAFNMSWQCASVSPSTDNALTMQYQCMGMLLWNAESTIGYATWVKYFITKSEAEQKETYQNWQKNG